MSKYTIINISQFQTWIEEDKISQIKVFLDELSKDETITLSDKEIVSGTAMILDDLVNSDKNEITDKVAAMFFGHSEIILKRMGVVS